MGKQTAASPFSCPALASSFRGCSSVGLLPQGPPMEQSEAYCALPGLNVSDEGLAAAAVDLSIK
jgi:hypothetical protein